MVTQAGRKIRLRFFVRNFFLFLIPAFLSIAIIGVLSYLFTYSKVKLHVEQSNTILLDKAMNNINSIIKELELLNINLSSNSSIKIRLKRIFSNKPLILTPNDHNVFRTILDMIFVSANSNKYIQSIYIFFENAEDLYITSTEKQIVSLSDSPDYSWFKSYINSKDSTNDIWSELRSVQTAYKENAAILTIYNKMYSTITGAREPDGVFVLNIYTDSINSLLDSFASMPGQILLVADSSNSIVFGSSLAPGISPADISLIDVGSSYLNTGNEKYSITQKPFEKFGWRFISLTPLNTLYEIPNQITWSMGVAFLLSVIFSTIFALHNTRNAYIDFCSLLTIIESAQKGEPVADICPPSSSTEYSYIIHNIITTFLEHDFLRIQLSEKRYKMQTLELRAMQAQMNPHFLLNAMEVIYWKAMNLTRGPNEATALIQDISNILHYSLYNPMQLVCLLEEIDIAKSYINIQMKRHKNLFVVIWDYDPMLVEYKINKLVLQPILENAIYHGRRNGGSKLKVKIKIYRYEDNIRINVIDNGKGIPSDKLGDIRESLNNDNTDTSQHIGLYNTHRRLLMMHGEPYGIKIFSRLNIGTITRVDIPFIS